MNYYNAGATVRIHGDFINNETNQPVDPDEVHFHVCCPGKCEKTYTYGTDSEIKRSGTGSYYMDIVGRSGFYTYKIYSDIGVMASSEESEFFVR